MYLSESVAFKGQQSHRCFPREGVRRPCVPLTECPRYMDAWLCNQTEHVSRLESQWLQAVPEDSKGFDKHRSSIPGMQIAPEDVRLAERERESTERQQNLTSLLSSWPGPKMSPEKPEPAFNVAKNILYSSAPQMYLSWSLHSARY